MSHYLNLDQLGSIDDVGTLEMRLRVFQGFEELSRLYRYELEADLPANKVSQLTADAVLGKKIAFSIRGERVWQFGGIVLSLEFGDIVEMGRRSIEITVVPDLWKLTQIIDTQSFPGETVPKLVQQVIQNSPVTHKLDDRTSTDEADHPRRINPVQYDEDLLTFLARLMDEEAIFYFFQAEDSSLLPATSAIPAEDVPTDREMLVLGDQIDDYLRLKDPRPDHRQTDLVLNYKPRTGNAETTTITEWHRQLNFRPSFWSLQDYDYQKSDDFNMIKSGESLSNGTDDSPLTYRKFQRAAGYADKSFGDSMLHRRNDLEAQQREFIRAESFCPEILPGGIFELAGHDSVEEDGEYIVTSVEHLVVDDEGSDHLDYRNWFTCVRKRDLPIVHCPNRTTRGRHGLHDYAELASDYLDQSIKPNAVQKSGRSSQDRALRQRRRRAQSTVTPRPPAVHRPPEIAYVCDANGDYDADSDNYGKVHTDADAEKNYGRVLIRFPWEEDGDFQSDRWVRVAQMIASNNWGGKFLPRVGDEVIVMYIDGTERKPLVVGAVYNSAHLLTNQSDSEIWKLQNETSNPFNSKQPDDGALASTATDRLPDLDSIRTSDSVGNPTVYTNSEGVETAYQAATVPSLKDPNVSGFRTRSIPTSSDDDDETPLGYNELLFNDKRGEEQIYIRAEKDLNIKVQSDLNIEVGGNKNEIIRGDYYRVANVGPATNPYADSSNYATLSDGGVKRAITEGVNYDYDKVWQVWTVETFSDGKPGKKLDSSHRGTFGDAKYYRVSTETFADVDDLTVGDVKETFNGNYEEYFYGKKYERVEGSNDDDPATITTRVKGYTDEEFDGKTHASYKGTEVHSTYTGVSVVDLYLGCNAFTFHAGAREDIMVGGTLDIAGPLATEIFLGGKFELFVGGLLSVHAGAKKEIGPDDKEIVAMKKQINSTQDLVALVWNCKAASILLG